MLGAARAVAWALLLATGALAGWMPDEDAIPPANRTWLERIADELDRSLTVYRRPKNVEEAENLVFRLLDDPERSVLVLGRTVLVDRRLFVRPNKKGLLHLEFLRSLLERGASGNVAYLWEWSADGFKSQDQLIREGCPAPKRMGSGKTEVKPKSWIYQKQKGRPELPYLAIAKRYGYDQCGILIPNCYFDSRDWDETVAGIVNSNATKIPLEAKDKRVFWRGAIRNEMAVPKGRCVLEGGNFARAEAVALSVAKPDLFDIKCQEKCTPRDDVKMPCSEFTFDPTTRAALKKLKSIKSDYVPRDDFGRYQYLLNLPGSVSGSYSRNLNHLWLVGSIVAMWDAPFVEFYYPALEEGDTHVAFDRTTAESTLKAVTPERSERLLKNARRVGEELLCPDCLANYWRLVIAKMRAHFKLADVLDNRKFVRRLLARFNMTNRELIAFHATPKGTQVHFITEKSQLAHVVYSGLNESETAKGPDPRRTANGAWNPLPPSYFQDMVRRRPTPPPTVKGANYGDGSNFLRSAVPDSLRFSTKLSLDKATGRLVSKVASARHRAKGVDDDGQFWHYSIDGNSNPVGGKRTGSWF